MKNYDYIQKTNKIVRKPTAKIIDDSLYWQDAYKTLLKNIYERKSLVDLILCALIQDVNVKIGAISTNGISEFYAKPMEWSIFESLFQKSWM